MKILGFEIIRVIEGNQIFKEHIDSEFVVNNTEMVYDLRGLIQEYTSEEIEKSVFYLVSDMREILQNIKQREI